MSKKGRSKGEKPEMEADAVQVANEELRAKLTSIQIEFQQEKSMGGQESGCAILENTVCLSRRAVYSAQAEELPECSGTWVTAVACQPLPEAKTLTRGPGGQDFELCPRTWITFQL